MVEQYIFSGSLPEDVSSYVTREADTQLYEGLKAGKFCYVLNSRQSGKSSLRVRTMQRLRDDGVYCAVIDFSAGGIHNVSPEQWYADLIDTLIDSFGLDVDFYDWWQNNQLNSLVKRFHKFIEEVLLVKISGNIVIFIDEISSVISLKFPTDNFFAFIRFCYNQRVDNIEYSRLTFCLLGVATPNSLIQDKKQTPFNIGKAILLNGFKLNEVEHLKNGFGDKFSNPQIIIQEIMEWTQGQPFLTQKLCQLILEEADTENRDSVEQVIRTRIIDNWESQDEPEHLRTIQSIIMRDEQRAGYLLEMYRKIWLNDEQANVIADNALEQSELHLSGLVIRKQGKLKVYNRIYSEIFDLSWINNQLKTLRPYAENFRFWIDSGCIDDSRLLRGKALQDAEEWARDKYLISQDTEFLLASKVKDNEDKIVAKERRIKLEREKQDREAAQKRQNLSGFNLIGSDFSEQNLSGFDFTEANLSGANLSGANLNGANLNGANLNGANLNGANLNMANLSKVHALETNFIAANFTGICIEDWHTNSATNLTGIICEYIYLKQGQQERRPISGNFASGEFTKLFQKSLETVDLIFRNGIDWDAFAYSFKKLEIENQGALLDVQSIEKKGDGILVVRVAVSPDADKAKIHSEFIQGYEFAAKALEAQYQARLEDKDTLISKQEAQINRLFNIVEQQGSVQKALAENPRKVSNYNMQNPQFASGIVDANTVNSERIGGNIHNNDA